MYESDTIPRIDELLGGDASVLDAAGLKETLLAVGRVRARLDATEADVLSAFEARGYYVDDGALTPAAWLSHHTGVGRGTAARRARLAKKLTRMPVMAAAMSAGLTTSDHARLLSRCLTPRTIEAFERDQVMLVDHAIAREADDFAHVVERWLLINDPDGPDPGGEKPSELRVSSMLQGRKRLDGELDLEDGAEVSAELETIYDELWRADRAADDSDPLKHRSHAQRLAAALVEMARRSSAAGNRDDATPRRPQLVTLVDIDALAGQVTGVAVLGDGTPLPQAILQRWMCDSSIGRVVMAGRSVPFDLGSVTYTPSPGQRRALFARDRGCIVPGCRRTARWCDAHHVVPWPEGPTDMNNLVLLCKRHHKQVHARVIEIRPEREPGRFAVYRRDGTRLKERPPPSP